MLHNLPLMQVMGIVVAYINMLRPGLADSSGDMRERALGAGVNLCQGELQLDCIASVSSVFCIGDATNLAL